MASNLLLKVLGSCSATTANPDSVAIAVAVDVVAVAVDVVAVVVAVVVVAPIGCVVLAQSATETRTFLKIRVGSGKQALCLVDL